MNELQPFDFEGHDVRVATSDDGQQWWALTDVCGALGLANSRDVASRLDEGEKNTVAFTDTAGRPHELTLINEPGLYRVIFRSNKPSAEKFRRWVFHDVLPALRRTGTYSVGGDGNAPLPPLTERETRYPDGTVIVERFGHGVARPAELPTAEPPSRNLEKLRAAFNGALRELGITAGFDATTKRAWWHELNHELKQVASGRARGAWRVIDYENAVKWLRFRRDIDIRWILEP